MWFLGTEKTKQNKNQETRQRNHWKAPETAENPSRFRTYNPWVKTEIWGPFDGSGPRTSSISSISHLLGNRKLRLCPMHSVLQVCHLPNQLLPLEGGWPSSSIHPPHLSGIFPCFLSFQQCGHVQIRDSQGVVKERVLSQHHLAKMPYYKYTTTVFLWIVSLG